MVETRERILAAARELYLREGAKGVTMRGVASRVGVTPTALYRHFESKDRLVEAVLSEAFQLFASYLHRSLSGESPGERLRLSGQAYLDFALERTEFYRTIFMTSAPRHRRKPREDEDRRKMTTFRFLVDRVAECMRAGVLAPADPEAVALSIWAHVHGLVSLYIAGAIPATETEFRQLYHASVGHLFSGLHG